MNFFRNVVKSEKSSINSTRAEEAACELLASHLKSGRKNRLCCYVSSWVNCEIGEIDMVPHRLATIKGKIRSVLSNARPSNQYAQHLVIRIENLQDVLRKFSDDN